MALTRREFLRATGGAIALAAAPQISFAQTSPATKPAQKYVTCFYQFSAETVGALCGPDALPNGDDYLHIFSHSSPGTAPRPALAEAVHNAGSSFKYCFALDVHKYPGWTTASDDQLRAWAIQFREACLAGDTKVDYFAFNEMPTTGSLKENIRNQAAKWMRHLHHAGGGEKFPGVFYFTEKNLDPNHWPGDSDDFWSALDETCELVVGEHYHSDEFSFQRNTPQLAEHYFALPRWLNDSGKAPQVNIAENKFAVLHSSYFGPKETGWAGLLNGTNGTDEVKKYLRHVIKATRSSEFGKRRIGFGPLATKDFDDRIVPLLAAALGKDARGS